eukprot:3548150-Lingulodinium_polyedra.AAC.1
MTGTAVAAVAVVPAVAAASAAATAAGVVSAAAAADAAAAITAEAAWGEAERLSRASGFPWTDRHGDRHGVGKPGIAEIVLRR